LILKSLAAAEMAKALHLRDFRSPTIFEFFNTIGHLQTCPAQDGMSASPLKADIATTNRNVG
jgi:hypothetical protein